MHTDHDLLVSVLDLRTVTSLDIDSTYEIPRLRKVLTMAYVKYGLNEFDLQQQSIEVDIIESSQGPKKKKAKAKEDRRALHVDDQQAEVVMLDTDVSAVQQKNYDLMGDLLEADILMLFRQVLREEESLEVRRNLVTCPGWPWQILAR